MAVTVDIVLPVLNEEKALLRSVSTLLGFLSGQPGRDWRITIADNGSTDGTQEIARQIASETPDVRVTRLEERGRGRALRKAWLESDSDVLCYMDVDLSTRLDGLPPLISAICDEGFDLAIGSRLLPDSHVVGRSLTREITSRGYSLLFRSLFKTSFRDAQCGFKAIARDAAGRLLPLTKDNGWFFDTELLLAAQKSGLKIKELPVHWTDDPDSRVAIVPTAWLDLKGLMRLRFGGVPTVEK